MGQVREKTLVRGSAVSVYQYLAHSGHVPSFLRGLIDAEALQPSLDMMQKGSSHSWLMTRYGLSQEVIIETLEAQPGRRLSYKQVQGLFVKFTHVMDFEVHDADYCLVIDQIDYELPFGIVGHLFDDLWVHRDIKKILRRRSDQLKGEFKLQNSRQTSGL